MKQILSIQSAVALGFVGNSVAAPVITKLGHKPILVDTMVLAAHPGYGLIAGGPASSDHFSAILTTLPKLGALVEIDSLITGYIGTHEQVDPIAALIDEWQDIRPDAPYVLDPVLGDNGRLYVNSDIVQSMCKTLLTRAQIITPNQFELALLSGMEINNATDADHAALTLLDRHVNLRAVVVTGINNDDGKIYDRLTEAEVQTAISYNKRPVGIAGGGDLLTAIFTSWLASGASIATSFQVASRDAHNIIDSSKGHLEIALFENLPALTPITI